MSPVSGSSQQYRSKHPVTCLLVSLVHIFVECVSSSGIAGPSDPRVCLALADGAKVYGKAVVPFCTPTAVHSMLSQRL